MLLLATVAILLAGPADAYANSALQYVGSFKGPARSDDGQTAVLMARDGTVTAVNRSGRVYSRALPPGCTPRRLRYPRLALACALDGAERPSVLNVTTGAVQTPPPATMGNRDAQASDSFFTAGRYWLEGIRTYTDGSSIPVVRHRYTPAQFRIWTGKADLDSPTYKLDPLPSSPQFFCGAYLTTTANRLRVLDCGRSTIVKGCPKGCYALADGALSGAYVEHDRVGQVALHSARVVRTWRLPTGRRERITLVLIGNAVFANLLVDGAWRVFRGELASITGTMATTSRSPDPRGQMEGASLARPGDRFSDESAVVLVVQQLLGAMRGDPAAFVDLIAG